MRSAFFVLALVATAAVCVSAQSSTGAAPPTPRSPCDRIVAAQGLDFTRAADAITALTNLVASATNASASTGGLFGNPLTKDFFNGVKNYRQGLVPQPFFPEGGPAPNFNTDVSARTTLVQHFVYFFGAPNALACTASIPTYSTTAAGFAGTFNQYQVHANMNITKSVFSAFISEVQRGAATVGASIADVNTLTSFLLKFNRNGVTMVNEICTSLTCDCATGLMGQNCDQPISSAASVQLPVLTLLLAAIVAVFAQRR